MKYLGKQLNDADIANMEAIRKEIASLVESDAETLETLAEVAKALEENADIVDALNASIGTKADKTEVSALSASVQINAANISTLEDSVNGHTTQIASLNSNKADKESLELLAEMAITTQNIGSQSVAKVGGVGLFDGKSGLLYAADGYCEMGKGLDFHNTDSTKDYSVRLMVNGDSGVKVYLPNKEGTIALLSDIPAPPTLQSLMGSGTIGSSMAFPYWNGSAWATQKLGARAFDDTEYIAKSLLGNNTLIHSGNIGNQKVAKAVDSDRLGTYAADRYQISQTQQYTGDLNDSTLYNVNQAFTLRLGGSPANLPTGMGYGNILYVTTYYDTGFMLAGSYSQDKLYYRGGSKTVGSQHDIHTKSWRQITFMGSDASFNSVKIGDATLSWDGSALKVDKAMYSTDNISAKGKATEGESEQIGALYLSSNISAGTYTDSSLANIGFTSDAIYGLLSGSYTKVVRQAGVNFSIAWDYAAHSTSSQGTTIILNGSVTSYKIYKAANASTWTVSII